MACKTRLGQVNRHSKKVPILFAVILEKIDQTGFPDVLQVEGGGEHEKFISAAG